MGTSHGGHSEIRNPGPFATPSGLKVLFPVLAGFGFGVFGVMLLVDPHRAWSGFVINHFFFMSLGLGGLFFAALQWLTGAMWSAPVRRVGEAFTAYLPFALVTSVVLFLGIHQIYHWSHADVVEADPILKGKSGYLNIAFFVIRDLLAVGLWIFFSRTFIGRSLAQDSDRSYAHTKRNGALAAIFMLVFAVSYTMVSFDQLMSLDPHWFSTIFGVYNFAGLFYSTLALMLILVVYLKKKGSLAGIVNENHIHDLGKLMFAFTVFWAYIGFSQFMLIWYANLPEEVGYYIHRFQGGWMAVSIFLLLGKFVTPFLILLPRGVKRNEKLLVRVACWMLFCQWVDVLWMVEPEFFPNGPSNVLVDLGIGLGFAGVFGLLLFRFLARNNVVAIGDPRLPEAVFHHHQ